MVRSLPLLALFAIFGFAAAAFFKPAVPHQAKPEMAFGAKATAASFDDGLDNPEVASDMNIHPARKCGFCIG